jgi:hypothetical protein
MIALVASSLRRVAVAALVLLVLAGCADVIDYDNPFDPESPASPLGFDISVLDFSVVPDPSGLRVAFLQWEDVPDALQYEAEIFGTDPSVPLFGTTTSTTEIGPVQVVLSSRYEARVRYEARFEYLGDIRTAWSPWRAAGSVAFEDGLSITVPTAGLIAEYTMDQVSGTVLIDSAGFNDGEIFGAQQVTGLVGQALSFDGDARDRVRVGVPDVPIGDAPRSISAWIRPTSGVAQTGNIVAWGDGLTQNRRWATLVLMPANGSGDVEVIGEVNDVNSLLVVPEGTWTHIAATYDGSVTVIYVNSLEVAASPPPAGPYDTDPGQPLMIGTNTENRDDEYFSGLIDELRIYDRALTPEEVSQLAGVPVTP